MRDFVILIVCYNVSFVIIIFKVCLCVTFIHVCARARVEDYNKYNFIVKKGYVNIFLIVTLHTLTHVCSLEPHFIDYSISTRLSFTCTLSVYECASRELQIPRNH